MKKPYRAEPVNLNNVETKQRTSASFVLGPKIVSLTETSTKKH